MPLGAARLTLLAFQPTVAVEAEVIRKKQGIQANGNAQVDTAISKFGGSSLLLDGTGDYLEIKPQNFSFGTGDFTIEQWIYQDNYSTSYDMCRMNDASNNSKIAITINNFEVLRIYINGSEVFQLNNTQHPLNLTTWHHIALTRSSGTLRFFVDGTQYGGDVSNSANLADIATYTIGWNQSTGFPSYWDGNIDEVRISDTARYTSGFTSSTTPFVNDDNTLLLLHCDGSDGSTYFDDDNGPNGRTRISVSAVGDAQIDTAQSYFGGSSAVFDGTGDYLKLSSPDFAFGTGDFTIECWARATTVSNEGVFHLSNSHLPATDDDSLAVAFYTAGTRWQFYANDVGQATNASHTPTTNTWYHIALVRTGGTTKLYIDGTQAASRADTKDYNNTTELVIGGYYNTSFLLPGNIDEFRISNTARYTANFTAPTEPFQNDANTLLLLHCDGADGSTNFQDDSGGRSAVGIASANGAVIDTAVSKFGGSSGDFYVNSNNVLYVGGSTTPFDLAPSASNEWTIECWIYFENSPSNFDSIIANAWPLGTRSFNLRLGRASPEGTGDQLEFVYRDTTNTQYLDLRDPSTISANTWTHIAVSSDGTNHRMFVGGSLVDTATARAIQAGTTEFMIGNAGGLANAFEGHIDEVRISDVCRYTTSFTAPTAPFVNDSNTLLLAHMDGTDASTLFLDDNGAEGRGDAVGVTAVNQAQIDTAQSKFGSSSALFDGTDDYLKIGDDTSSGTGSGIIPTTGEFTLECWVRFNTNTNYRAFITQYGYNGQANPVGRTALYLTNGNKFAFFINGGGAIAGTTSSSTGVWYHIAATRDSSNVVRLFVNGTEEGTNFTSSASIVDSYTAIGATSNSIDFDMDGHIDEMRVSNVARYTENFTAPTAPFTNDANTLMLLHMDGPDGSTTFLDDCGRTKTPLVSDGSAQIDTAQSKFGGSSMVTTSSQSEIVVYDATTYMPSRETNTWTVEMWIRPASVSGNDIFFDNRSDAVGNGWLIYLQNGVPQWLQANTNRTGGGTALSTNTWYHIAVSYDGSNVRLFVDGTQRGSDYAATGVFVVSDDCWIGNNQRFPTNTAGLDGHMDELRVSNIARYTANFTAPTEPFQNDANTELLIHFDGTDGGTDFVDDNGKESA